MGKIRTKTIKRASKKIIEGYFAKLGKDFYVNKRVVLDVTIANSKKLQNKISGYTTHLMKRLAKGPVRGISLKLQEEERERRMDFVPEVSWVDARIQEGLKVDKNTMGMLKKLEVGVPRYVKTETEEPVKVDKKRKMAPKRM